MIRSLVAIALSAATMAVSPANQPNNSPIPGSYRLPSGMEVLCVENHASPEVALDILISNGSMTDFEGYEGVSAATAFRVWFGGSVSPERFTRQVGGTSSVNPDRETTRFQATIPSKELDGEIATIGEAIAQLDTSATNAAIATNAFEVAGDQARANPTEAAYQNFLKRFTTAERAHPIYGLKGARFEDSVLRSYLERHYLPSAMKVVLTGDFAPQHAIQEIQKEFGPIATRQLLTGALPHRTATVGTAESVEKDSTHIYWGAWGPQFSQPREVAAFEVLREIFAGTPNARLRKELLEIPDARVADVRWAPFKDRGLFYIAIGAPADKLSMARDILLEQFADLRGNLVSLEEHGSAITRAVNRADNFHSSNQAMALAVGLASFTTGDLLFPAVYPDYLREVSRQDLMAVAQKYLSNDPLQQMLIEP